LSAELGRARDAAGRRERFGDVRIGEVFQRVLVDAFRVAPEREDGHHVREVDGLSPGRRANLDEEDIDQEEVPSPHHQVRRLDVAVGKTRVPETAHEEESFVDHLVVDDRIADLNGAVEELHHDHVFAFRSDLHEAERLRSRQAEVMEQEQRVVLVLDEPADGLERSLVLERAVEDRPPNLYERSART
jgi:hypothetical protein